MPRSIDLTDERLVPAKTEEGEPVVLVPMDDGEIRVIRRADLAAPAGSGESSVDLSDLQAQFDELTGTRPNVGSETEAEPSEEEMVAAFEAFRSGEQTTAGDGADFSEADAGEGPDGADLSGDDVSDEDVFDAWMQSWAQERGIDLAATTAAAPSLEVGMPVEWGQGQGKGHGILMEQIDTAEGKAIVHAAEVITHQMGGPQLSPTGKTIKVDAGKLRASQLPLVGEVPIGPELADSPDVGNEKDTDESFFEKVQRQMKKMGGGFGA